MLVDLPPPSVVPEADNGGDTVGDSGAGNCTEVNPANHSNRVAEARQPIGFVTNGAYSWERGRPNGVGFASVVGLRELFSKDVLVGLCRTPPTAAVRS